MTSLRLLCLIPMDEVFVTALKQPSYALVAQSRNISCEQESCTIANLTYICILVELDAALSFDVRKYLRHLKCIGNTYSEITEIAYRIQKSVV